ncbi:hypothetical protein IF1G_04048 [Cordyceps javanica]|uniref:Uncharacterized protein n=1 Tax=Cordyceps javanica TaxID=43265 RepID=A0A545V519_9HYPO|nr:hypothetical protein IF1G_04048 [Cordyceps javanica]
MLYFVRISCFSSASWLVAGGESGAKLHVKGQGENYCAPRWYRWYARVCLEMPARAWLKLPDQYMYGVKFETCG